MSGTNWDLKVAPPCLICENALRTQPAAPVVAVMEAAEAEEPKPTAMSAAPKSSNTMPMFLPSTKMNPSRIAEVGTAVALAAAPMNDAEGVDVDSLGHWLRFCCWCCPPLFFGNVDEGCMLRHRLAFQLSRHDMSGEQAVPRMLHIR
jgi:hypothetical protein